MKGTRVIINASFPMPVGWEKTGTVVAESERCLGVRVDNQAIPLILQKGYVKVLTAGTK